MKLEKEIYIFSGLGADERVFQLLDFSGFNITFVKWIEPKHKETIEHYAGRILNQITTPNPIIIGLSFGGIMAIEVAKQIDAESVIIIASAKTKYEIPFYFRFAGKIRLHKLLPASIMKSSNFITNWFFGAKTKFEKQLLKQILKDTNSTFLRWAIDKIVHWKNEKPTKNIFHIHGTKDRILPIKYVSCDVSVNNGGHFMTINQPEQLSNIIRQKLS